MLKRYLAIYNLVLLLCCSVLAQDLAHIPPGKLEPFWLTPVTSKKVSKSKAKISIPAFGSMRFAVTVGEYRKFLEDNPKWNKENASSLFVDALYLENLKNEKIDLNSPMTNVSWFAAKAYCKSIKMRLPTVNEWEYMAAASEKSNMAYSDPKFLQRILDWYSEPQNGNLKKVGSIYKNKYGVWDLHGLIWEWVDDFNSSFVTGESREDSSFNKNMFCGGGSMSAANKEDYAAFMRFAFRSSINGKSSVSNLGFRCVR